MLDINMKIEYFEQILSLKNTSYSDRIKDEIYSYFFEMLGDKTDIGNFSFLNILATKEDIDDRVNLIVSKIIMHEHHAGIEDLILEYI